MQAVGRCAAEYLPGAIDEPHERNFVPLRRRGGRVDEHTRPADSCRQNIVVAAAAELDEPDVGFLPMNAVVGTGVAERSVAVRCMVLVEGHIPHSPLVALTQHAKIVDAEAFPGAIGLEQWRRRSFRYD